MINILTSLRFFAILLIYFHHLSYPGGLGSAAVTFFFVLSGFVIAYSSRDKFLSLNRNEVQSFYVKRLSKVYPLHVLTFFLSIPIVYATRFKINFLSALLNILLLHTIFPMGIQVFAFNSLAWFLADIVFFYFLTPFLMFGLQKIRTRPNKVPILLVLLLLVITLEASLAYITNSKMEPYSTGWWLFYIAPWIRVFDYSAGLIAGLLFISAARDSQTETSKILFSLLEIIAMAAFVGAMYYAQLIPSPSLVMSAYYVPCSVFLVFIYAFQKGWISAFFTRNIFVYLGNLSFTFFMLHQIVILYVVIFFLYPMISIAHSTKQLIAQLLLLINIMVLSDVISRCFEEPIRKQLLSKFDKTSKTETPI